MSLNITSFKRNLTVLYNLLTHKIKVTFGSRKVLRKEKVDKNKKQIKNQ